MVPKKIVPYFKKSFQKKDSDAELIGGDICCCSSNRFEIRYIGEIKHGLFSKAYLYSGNSEIALEACCEKCNKVISVFDSSEDGYETKKEPFINNKFRVFSCKKCNGVSFSISIKYEYPNEQELDSLGISERDSAFTWIWASLKCNKCGTEYKKFVDFETS